MGSGAKPFEMIESEKTKVANLVTKSKPSIGPRWKHGMFPLIILTLLIAGGLVYCLWLNS